MTGKERQLSDLVSIGPAMLRDFELLGVRTVAQLARRNPEKMYEKLCQVTGQAQDICCLDVFRAEPPGTTGDFEDAEGLVKAVMPGIPRS